MISTRTNNSVHVWKFFRIGGTDQVRLDTGADLVALDQLDPKLWVALSCPTRGLEFDAQTLDLIDSDKDGRIRTPEIIAATKWAANCLKKPDDLIRGDEVLSLNAINDATPEGRQLLASAKQILANLGKSEAASISAEDTSDTTRIFSQTKFNGDGIVTADSADDPAVKAAINDILACLSAETDRSGKPGVNQGKVDQFFADAQAYSDWCWKAETDPSLMPLGEATASAFAALQAVKAKVGDYFGRCRLAAFDPRTQAALNRQESEYVNLAAKELSLAVTEAAGFPLARVEPARPLPLKEGVNPAWAEAIATLQAAAIRPLLGDRAAITEADWTSLVARFAAYEGWVGCKAGIATEKLGVKRVREILAGKAKDALAALLAKDNALEPEANAIAAVDKLVRYHRDLYKLLNNFVNFRDFYSPIDKAIFQAGTLYLDQRSCELCLTVENPGKHAAMAGLAGVYLAYCDCTRKSAGEKIRIVAAFTDGDSDNLMVGRNGVFYDRQGRDWDATITTIIDNPISIRQAFWGPYKKLVRLIEEQAAKRAAALDGTAFTKLQAAAKAAAEGDKAKPVTEPRKFDAGVVAALGVGVGAVGTALGYFLGFFRGMAPWQVPLVIGGVMLIISAPSMVIAWLKLRKRNLGPILDANGWAVNAKARITVPFGHSLTGIAKLPPGSQRGLVDPFAERTSLWPKVIVLAMILWITYSLLDNKGLIHNWTNGWLGSPAVKQVEKGAVTPPPATAPAAEPAK